MEVHIRISKCPGWFIRNILGIQPLFYGKTITYLPHDILEGTVFSTKADHQTQLHTAGPTRSMLKSFISLAGTNHGDYKAYRKKLCFNFCTQEKDDELWSKCNNQDNKKMTSKSLSFPTLAKPTCETATSSQCHLHNVLAVNHQKSESWFNSTKVSHRKRHIANSQRFFSTNITFQALTTYPKKKKIALEVVKHVEIDHPRPEPGKLQGRWKSPSKKKKSSGPCLQDDKKLLFAPLLTDKGICGWGWRSAIPCQRVFLWGSFLLHTFKVFKATLQ